MASLHLTISSQHLRSGLYLMKVPRVRVGKLSSSYISHMSIYVLALVAITLVSPFSLKAQTRDSIRIEVRSNGDTLWHYLPQRYDFTPPKGEKSMHPVRLPHPQLSSMPSGREKETEISPHFLISRSTNSPQWTPSIPYNRSITPSGAITYSIPIETAKGYKYAPQIALTYNSQSGNGIVGYGWELSGLSNIVQTDRSIHYDGETSSLQGAGTSIHWDALRLDGMRLVRNTSLLPNQYPYITEQGKILVRYIPDTRSYEARFPDGTIALYETLEPLDLGTYVCRRKIDLRGRVQLYDYQIHEHTPYLSRVTFGQGTNIGGGVPLLGTTGSLTFTYEARQDTTEHYVRGVAIRRGLILRSIHSYDGTTLLATYTLSHRWAAGTNLLRQIDYSSEGISLHPITCTYKEEYPSPEDPYEEHLQTQQSKYLEEYIDLYKYEMVALRGHFTTGQMGDGMLLYPRFKTYTRKVINRRWPREDLHGSMYDPKQQILIVPHLQRLHSSVLHLEVGEGFFGAQAVDTDGDGIDEVVKLNLNLTEDRKKTLLGVEVYEINGRGKQGLTLKRSFRVTVNGVVENKSYTSPRYLHTLWGQFCGDGSTQLAIVTYNKTVEEKDATPTLLLVNLQQGSVTYQQDWVFNLSPLQGSSLTAMDLDGDGLTELCLSTVSNTIERYHFNAQGTALLRGKDYSQGSGGISPSSQDLLWGDLNGDGLIDALCPVAFSGYKEVWERVPQDAVPIPEDSLMLQSIPRPREDTTICRRERIDHGNQWGYYINTGSGFHYTHFPVYQREDSTDKNDQLILLDVNHDGRADLVRIHDKNGIDIHLNEQGKLRPQSLPTHERSNAVIFLPLNISHLMAPSQFITIGNRGELKGYTYLNNLAHARLLAGLIDSRGVVHQQDYQDLNALSELGTKAYRDTGNVHIDQRYAPVRAPWSLVTSTFAYYSGTGIPYFENSSYTYEDGYIDRLGLGFVGFGRVTKKDYLLHIQTTTQNLHTLRGAPSQEETWHIPSMTLLQSKVYDYRETYGSNKEWNLLLSRSVDKDYLKGVSSHSDYQYDELGYPTHMKLAYGKSNKIVERKLRHRIGFSYHLGILEEQTEITQKESGQSSITSLYTYNSDFQPIKIDKYLNGNPQLTIQRTQSTYDRWGNVTSECTLYYDSPKGSTKSYIYDETGHHLLSTRDALGLETRYADHEKHGRARRITDPLGQMTRVEYDAFGLIAQETTPDGTVTSTTHEQHPDGTYTIVKRRTGTPTSYRVCDALDRELRTGTEQHDGSILWEAKMYDGAGRVVRSSLPYRDGTQPLWIEHEYDMFGRQIAQREPSGVATTWAYELIQQQGKRGECNQITETKGGISIKRTYGELGELLSSEDLGGKIIYSYRPDGQVDRITAPGDVVTSFEYDTYGRQTALNDPSSGRREITYAYAQDGTHTERKSSPNGGVTTVTDPYGRLVRIERDKDFSTSYTYDDYSRLTEERSTNGSFKSYTYDALGRTASLVEGVSPSKTLRRTYYYGSGGELARLTYHTPNEEEFTELYIYEHGHHVMTLLQSPLRPQQDTIWHLLSVNNMGVPIRARTGGQERTYSYDPVGLLTGRSMGAVQEERYTFDPQTGNLLERQWRVEDSVRRQTFSYDNLHRLTRWASGECSYTPNGCLSETGNPMTGGCSFHYEEAGHPYRLTRIEGHPGINLPPNLPSLPGGNPVTPDLPNGKPDDPGSQIAPIYFARDTTVFDRDIYDLLPRITSDQIADYTSFDRPKSFRLKDASSIWGDEYRAQWDYNSALERTKLTIQHGDTLLRELYYWGSQYEEETRPKQGETTARLYLQGDAYTAPAVLVREGGQWRLYYIARDYLGSITNIVDDQGISRAHYHYTPWGRLEEGEGLFLGRGFTGHEHLPEFELINMNARLYDPYTGCFLSPDPYIQLPDFTQSLNRYSYCLNNPLRFTDRNGKFFFTAILGPAGAILDAACWGALMGGGFYTAGMLLTPGGLKHFSFPNLVFAMLSGAVNGALNFSTVSLPLWGNFSLGFMPQISFGTDGVGIGWNVTFSYASGIVNAGLSYGASVYGSAPGSGETMDEFRFGYGLGVKHKSFELGAGSTYFLDNHGGQQTGQMYAGAWGGRLTYENDTWAPVPGLWRAGGHERDKYRTAALRFDITSGKLKGANLGMLLYTGAAAGTSLDGSYYSGGTVDNYRMGVIYVGYKGWRVGLNSERYIREPIQNGFHDLFGAPHFKAKPDGPCHFYSGYYLPNPNTLW